MWSCVQEIFRLICSFSYSKVAKCLLHQGPKLKEGILKTLSDFLKIMGLRVLQSAPTLNTNAQVPGLEESNTCVMFLQNSLACGGDLFQVVLLQACV